MAVSSVATVSHPAVTRRLDRSPTESIGFSFSVQFLCIVSYLFFFFFIFDAQ